MDQQDRPTRPDPEPPHGTFGQRFGPLFLLGLLGIFSLPVVLLRELQVRGVPEAYPDMSPVAIALLSTLNPLLLLVLAAAVGARLAHRMGLVSLVIRWRTQGRAMGPDFRPAVAPAVIAGVLVGAALVALDWLFLPQLSETWRTAMAESPGYDAAELLAGLLYGGITEEIMLRWGALSFIVWALWRVLQRGRGEPSVGIWWSAIVFAALLFGAGHLPAVAAVAPLDDLVIARTVALNALAGVVYGWLFWRWHLEAAMLAHASSHIAMAALALAGMG